MSFSARIIVLVLSLAAGIANEAAHSADNTPAAMSGSGDAMTRLAPNLQKLLTEEMLAIDSASQKIVAALVSGDSATVAKQAQGIHDSFILEKKLSKEDREALEKALPQGFLVLDTALHGKAQQLSNVAQRGDLEMENFFFGRMIETCQACHSRFAAGKFLGYTPQAQVGEKK